MQETGNNIFQRTGRQADEQTSRQANEQTSKRADKPAGAASGLAGAQAAGGSVLKKPRLTIRIGRNTLSFSAPDTKNANSIVFEPYTVRSGISMAANLREAFREIGLPGSGWQRAMVLIDSPALMMPVDEYNDSLKATLYHHAVTGRDAETVMSAVLPSLNAVAVYSINKDLKLVIDDHFSDARFTHVCAPVWEHLYRRSFTGVRQKLYAYFHDKKIDVFSFQQNRFKFTNSFDTNLVPDAVYFIGNGAFWNCTRLKNISIPARVENIGADAFNYCINLEAADIPDNVKEIGDRAFRSCNKLAAVTLPTALKTIGDEAFAYCTMFSEITIPADVKSLGVSTDRYGNYVTCPFIGCDNLRTIYMRCAEAPEGLAPTLWLLSQDCGAAVKVYVPRGASAGYAKQLDDFRNDHGVSGTIAEFEEYDL